MDASVKKTLAGYSGTDRVVSSIVFSQMLKDAPATIKHMTGLKELDSVIGGFEPGELIVISGPTAMGKTTLCSSIIQNLNAVGKRSLFFTFEVTPAKAIENHKAPETVVYLPLEHKSMDLEWLQARTAEAIEKFKVAAVFIDHLHYIVDMASHRNMSLEIGTTMRYLKRDMAISLNIPVFVVCHSGKVPLDQEPSIHHLRDSSFVGQEADTVLIVFRRFDKDYEGKALKTMLQGLAVVKVEKARRTGAMGVKIRTRKEGIKLVESIAEPGDENDSDRSEVRYERKSRSIGAN
jgi:replicative DNA helicase